MSLITRSRCGSFKTSWYISAYQRTWTGALRPSANARASWASTTRSSPASRNSTGHAMRGRITLVCLVHGGVATQVVEIQVDGEGQRGPEIGQQTRGDPLPRGRRARESEPGRGDHRGRHGVAGLGFEIAQCHEAAEGVTEQRLGPVHTAAHLASKRLEVSQQLAEAGQVATAA